MQYIWKRRDQYDLRIRIILLQSKEKLIQISCKGILFSFLQAPKLLFRSTEPVIGSSHDKDHICILRDLLVSVYESILPVPPDGRTSDPEIHYLFCAKYFSQLGRIGHRLIILYGIQIRCCRNTISKTGNLTV